MSAMVEHDVAGDGFRFALFLEAHGVGCNFQDFCARVECDILLAEFGAEIFRYVLVHLWTDLRQHFNHRDGDSDAAEKTRKLAADHAAADNHHTLG